jgi:hypothetical protein
MWLAPDRPGPRKKRLKCPHDFLTLTRNDNGLHFNGPMLIPPKSRFQECPIEHINANQYKYARQGIERIDVKPIWNIPGIAEYAFKTIKWGRADPGDILILPLSSSELPQKSPTFASCDRGIKDLQSAYNLSDELAQEIYAERDSHGF